MANLKKESIHNGECQQLDLEHAERSSVEARPVTPEVLARLEHGHNEHALSFQQVRQALMSAGLEVREVRWPTVGDTAGVDLVVTVGGDSIRAEAEVKLSGDPNPKKPDDDEEDDDKEGDAPVDGESE